MNLNSEWFDRRLFSPDDGGAGAGSSSPAAPAASGADAGSSSEGGSAAASPSPEGTSDGVNDFSGLGIEDYDDLEALPESAPVEVTPPVKPATPTEPTKVVAPKAVEAKPAAQAPAPVAGQQEPVAQAASPSPAGPQNLVEAMDANRDALITAIAQDMFAMTKEEAEAIETDFVGNLPKLGAKVFYQATRATHNIINQLVPQLIEKHLGAIKKREETENAFYGQFTGLDKSKHHADVVQFAQTFRQVNPNVTQAELWAMVGASVAAKHGLTNAQAAQVVAQANGRTPPRPPASEPFVPARPGAVVKSTPEPDNPWGGLGKDFDDEG